MSDRTKRIRQLVQANRSKKTYSDESSSDFEDHDSDNDPEWENPDGKRSAPREFSTP